MSKTKIIFLTILIVVGEFVGMSVLGVLVAGLPWTIIYIGGYLSPDPPQPQVEYAEFPFELVYEIEGEERTVKDTLVIEHKGVKWNEAQGKHNKWNRYLKSQRVKGYIRHNVILFNGLLENGDSAIIYLELGSCEYYMGLEDDMKYYYYSDIKPGDLVINSRTYTGPINEEELFEKFNIKIIKKTISDPISGH